MSMEDTKEASAGKISQGIKLGLQKELHTHKSRQMYTQIQEQEIPL